MKKNSNNVDKFGKWCNDNIERKLFSAKHLILIAVFGALILSVALFFSGLYEIYEAILYLLDHELKLFSIYTLKSADTFLFGMVMIIFSLGSYNLFISKIDNIDVDIDNHILPSWLQFDDFNELKTLFLKVIILILSISFLEAVIENMDRLKHAELYNLLIIPLGILMLAYSVKLMHHSKNEK